MTGIQRFLFFILLPPLGVLLITPEWFQSTFIYWMIPVAVLLPFFGVGLFQGRSTALTLVIFLLGFNVIMRLMMFFPHFSDNAGQIDLPYMLASLGSIAICTFLLLRLDQVDVRVQMTR